MAFAAPNSRTSKIAAPCEDRTTVYCDGTAVSTRDAIAAADTRSVAVTNRIGCDGTAVDGNLAAVTAVVAESAGTAADTRATSAADRCNYAAVNINRAGIYTCPGFSHTAADARTHFTAGHVQDAGRTACTHVLNGHSGAAGHA